MRQKIMDGLWILVYTALVCLCVSLLCSPAAAESPADLANTENHEGFLGFCTLPDGGLVLAGYTENSGPEKSAGRLLCLNADRTVRWIYKDEKTSGFTDVILTEDSLLAALCFGRVKFFTLDGQPVDRSFPYIDADVYMITAFGVLRERKPDGNAAAECTELVSWDGDVLFRISEPASMWSGTSVIGDADGLVLFGQAAGDPAEAAPKIMKVNLQGNTVWETVLPFLSEQRTGTGVCSGIRTADGGYLAVLWDIVTLPGGDSQERHSALVRLDSAGQVLWLSRPDCQCWGLAEYNGQYVTYEQRAEPGADRTFMHYLWLDDSGNEQGTAELRFRDEDLPPYVSGGNLSMTGEALFPMGDGLWQMISFWENADPADEDPAWTQQDNALFRVPER